MGQGLGAFRLLPMIVAVAFQVRDALFELFNPDDGGAELLPKKLNRVFATAGLGRESAFQ